MSDASKKDTVGRTETEASSVPAALYVRAACFTQAMLDEQREALEVYAGRNGMRIVRCYVEGGQPGKMRDALMEAVLSGSADFAVIVMRDASRWGRWPDEEAAARCEYLCLKAGVLVRYVNEGEVAKSKIAQPACTKAVGNAVS